MTNYSSWNEAQSDEVYEGDGKDNEGNDNVKSVEQES